MYGGSCLAEPADDDVAEESVGDADLERDPEADTDPAPPRSNSDGTGDN